MENPAKEISSVIHLLTQSHPAQQRETIETYFTPNASFTHPFCRTGSWENSRFLIHAIYRWYKIMSPRIDLTVNSVAFDEPNLILYVNISQIFRIWLFPWFSAPVVFTTVIRLQQNKGDGKYYIISQDDLYQVDQWVKFIPFLPGAQLLVWIWHYWATAICVLGTLVSWPITMFEELWGHKDEGAVMARRNKRWVDELELRDLERKSLVNG